MPGVRTAWQRTRSIDGWIDRDRVLDSWVEPRRRRRITLYGLVEPLRDHGYVAVTQLSGRQAGRIVVLLRNENALESLAPATEVAELRKRAREVSRLRRGS